MVAAAKSAASQAAVKSAISQFRQVSRRGGVLEVESASDLGQIIGNDSDADSDEEEEEEEEPKRRRSLWSKVRSRPSGFWRSKAKEAKDSGEISSRSQAALVPSRANGEQEMPSSRPQEGESAAQQQQQPQQPQQPQQQPQRRRRPKPSSTPSVYERYLGSGVSHTSPSLCDMEDEEALHEQMEELDDSEEGEEGEDRTEEEEERRRYERRRSAMAGAEPVGPSAVPRARAASIGGSSAHVPPFERRERSAAALGGAIVSYHGPPPDIFNMPRRGSQPFGGPAQRGGAARPQMSTNPLTYESLLQAAFSGDTLSTLCNLLGLRRFHVFGLVCTAWHDAIKAKMREWGVLTYVRSIGRGFGKRRGQFDMPTWLCMVPDGLWGSYLCVVDACNYRLQVLNPADGTVVKVVGRPGAGYGELSSPSSVACEPKTCGKRIFTSSNVGPDDRRIMKFDLESWALLDSTPEGTGKTQLDAPEGMTIASGRLYVVDTANHRIVAFDTRTLEKVGQYPPADTNWTGMRRASWNGKAWDQLDNPMDIVAHEGELFVSDTHNDRIQVFNLSLDWIGVIGQRGKQAGQFLWPRGLAIAKSGQANWILYVAEQSRIQGLTLLGEPRIIVPVPGATNLCGICVDGMRVFCTDMDSHLVHVLRLSHSEGWREKRREAIAEAKLRKELRKGGADAPAGQAKQKEQRSDKELQRDRAVKAVLGGRTKHQMLGLDPHGVTDGEVKYAIRLAMRLLHPDHSMNLRLKGTPEFVRIEAAFKKVNNLKDERIESFFHSEEMKR